MIGFSQVVKPLSQISGICFLPENYVANTSRKKGNCFENSNCFLKKCLKNSIFFQTVCQGIDVPSCKCRYIWRRIAGNSFIVLSLI